MPESLGPSSDPPQARRLRPAPFALFVLALAPIAVLGGYAYRVSAQSTRELVLSGNEAGARLARNLVETEFQYRLDTLEAFVRNPGFIDAMAARDEEIVRERLGILVQTQPGVERAFVTDREGLLWSDYPRAEESLGRNFSDREWYRGLSAQWRPYVSGVYRRNALPQVLLVAVAAPVHGRDGELLGAAVYQIEVVRLTQLLNDVTIGLDGHVLLLDHQGLLAAHPTLDLRNREHREYAETGLVRGARHDTPTTEEYTDPVSGAGMLGTSLQCRVGSNFWTILTQQPAAKTRMAVQTLGWQIALAGLLVAGGLAGGLALLASYQYRLAWSLKKLDEINRELSTENRERRRRFGTLLANLPGMAYRCRADEARTMEFVSDGCEALTGYPPEAFAGAGKPAFRDLIHPDDRDMVQRRIEHAVSTGQPFTVTYRLASRQKGEAERWVWERGRAVEGESVDAAVLEGFMTDITEQKSLEQQLLQSQKMEAIGQLAGGVAHDFNNLLSVINGYSAMMLDELPLDHALRSELLEINGAGERAAALTRQLLAFSRKQLLKPGVLDLNRIVGDMDGMLRRLIGEDIDLITRLDPELDPVKVDASQIEQIVMNLVVNARDAMPEGGKLTIETGNVELDEAYADTHAGVKAGPHVMLAVSDTGTGMDEATRQRIFEPFFTTKRQGKGTGLGLSTVFGIVKQSGGNVWVYSEPNRGTTFKVYLPRAEGLAGVAPRPEPGPATRGAGELILVVEDEAGVRGMIRTILERNGYRVIDTADAAEARAVLEREDGRVDLLLTDLVMPGEDGLALSRKALQQRPDLKIILMSGYTDDAVAHRGMVDRGAAFIEKPILPGRLLRMIRQTLDKA